MNGVYAEPAVPAVTDVVVIVSAAALMLMLKVPNALCCELSVTVTWNVTGVLVAAVGVPDTAPPLLSVNPAGRVDPDARAQV